MSNLYRKEIIGNCTLYLGDCLEILPSFHPSSFDLICADVPYGVTQNKWDVVIDVDKMFAEYRRLITNTGIIALTATQPFATDLINAGRDIFRYDLVWEKHNASGFLNANRMPLRAHELVLIFYKKLGTYNPQKIQQQTASLTKNINRGDSSNYNKAKQVIATGSKDGSRFPRSIFATKPEKMFFDSQRKDKGMHPTQKQQPLIDYLVRTYSNAGDRVLDNTMGSGTAGVSCQQLDREFVGIEKEQKYFDMACGRISTCHKHRPVLLDLCKRKTAQLALF